MDRKQCIKLLGLVVLLLCASSAQAQGFPNNYAGKATLVYLPDSTGATPGKVAVTITFTGATSGNTMNQSGIKHTPWPLVKLCANGVCSASQQYQGPGFLPNTDMGGWSHTFTLDLNNDGCSFDVLMAGGCELDNEPQIQCPIHGFFAIPWQKVQFEVANTTSYLNRGSRYWNGTQYVYNPTAFCSGASAPDFPGPDIVFDDEPFGGTIGALNANYIRTQDLGWRLAAWGTAFTGLPWEWFNLPRTIIGGTATPYLQMAVAQGSGICSRKDPPSANPPF